MSLYVQMENRIADLESTTDWSYSDIYHALIEEFGIVLDSWSADSLYCDPFALIGYLAAEDDQ